MLNMCSKFWRLVLLSDVAEIQGEAQDDLAEAAHHEEASVAIMGFGGLLLSGYDFQVVTPHAWFLDRVMAIASYNDLWKTRNAADRLSFAGQ